MATEVEAIILTIERVAGWDQLGWPERARHLDALRGQLWDLVDAIKDDAAEAGYQDGALIARHDTAGEAAAIAERFSADAAAAIRTAFA